MHYLVSFLSCSPLGWQGIAVPLWTVEQVPGSRLCGTHVSEIAWWIFFPQILMELSKPEIVQHHSDLPICPICAYHGTKTSQIWCPWFPDFLTHMDFSMGQTTSLLDGFSMFRVICLFAPYRPKKGQCKTYVCSDLWTNLWAAHSLICWIIIKCKYFVDFHTISISLCISSLRLPNKSL